MKYEKLDQMILNKIGTQPVPFHKIYVGDVVEESERLATELNKTYPFRFVDSRLQSLRKKGLIVNISSSKGWMKL